MTKTVLSLLKKVSNEREKIFSKVEELYKVKSLVNARWEIKNNWRLEMHLT